MKKKTVRRKHLPCSQYPGKTLVEVFAEEDRQIRRRQDLRRQQAVKQIERTFGSAL